MAVKKAKIFTITSVKGGTGKTTTALNLAGILSKKKKVLLIDLDLYGSAIAAALNIDDTNNIYRLTTDISNNVFDYIENYVTSYHNYFDVLSAPKDPRMASKINSKYLNIILTRASTKYDVILIDTNHVIDEINLTAMDLSDKIIYVITSDPIELKNMKTMMSIFKDMEKNNSIIILNKSINRLKRYVTDYDISNIIKKNIDYIIPSSFYIKNIDKYTLDGQILTLNKNILMTYKNSIDKFNLIANNLLKEKGELND